MATYGDSAAIPPEVNYYTHIAGDHAASASVAAATHQALADMLTAQAAVMQSNATGTAIAGWQGLGGLSMLGSATATVADMEAAVAWLNAGAAQIAEIVTAYHTTETSMVPGEVCDANRAEQADAVATNFMGFRTPEIVALDAQYFGHFWTQNASFIASFEAVVAAALAELAIPAPIAPIAADPAAPLAGAAAGMGQAAATGGMQGGLQGISEATEAPATASGVAGAPAASGGEAVSSLSQLPAMAGQLPQMAQMAGQLPQMAGQLPQMASQFPQMFTGMLGQMPLSGGAGNAALEPVGALGASTVGGGAGAASTAGAGAVGGGGFSGAGFGSAGAVSSSFTRPVSSFSTPSAPTLPSGWSAAEPVPSGGQPTGVGAGGGGLYGAPAAAGREGSTQSAGTSARTMQVAMRPGSPREERPRN